MDDQSVLKPMVTTGDILRKHHTGWWFGTFGLFFHSVGNVIIPTDELHHFSEG
jgi:hypothetical protein